MKQPSKIDYDVVYPIREDTLLLLDAAAEEIRASDRVLEVGIGSGYIAAHLQGRVTSLLATDVNPHAAGMAKKGGTEVIRTDLMTGICGVFDLILFNPPYLPTQQEERIEDWLEYALDGGPSGREVIARFAKQAVTVLAPQGRILLLISSLTGQKEVESIFERLGMAGQIVMESEIEGEILFVYRFYMKGDTS